MKINDFTQDYIDLFLEKCNFTEEERRIFEYKKQQWTDIKIAFEMNMSESNVQAKMRKIRYKMDEVLRQHTRNTENNPQVSCCGHCIMSHTMEEWAKIPNFLSTKGMFYIFSDYRTENEVNIPRIKIGDGLSPLSELPFATMSITDSDMSYWDDKPDMENNDFGKEIIIDDTYNKDNHFIFPTDGYVTLEFDNKTKEHAIAHIYGANGKTGFEFSKYTDRDNQSKEVFVKKGMQCEFISASPNAIIKFVPLV